MVPVVVSRAAAGAALLLVLLVVLAAPAVAHNGHEPLPDGFRAQITAIVDEGGKPVDLPGVDVDVATAGIGLTVSNSTARPLELAGEQAGEPLVRVTADSAQVNQASPQAADVEGATVDAAAVADLMDLAWKRAKADWVALPEGGRISMIDHRGAPGHPPVRAEYASGETVGTFNIPLV